MHLQQQVSTSLFSYPIAGEPEFPKVNGPVQATPHVLRHDPLQLTDETFM